MIASLHAVAANPASIRRLLAQEAAARGVSVARLREVAMAGRVG